MHEFGHLFYMKVFESDLRAFIEHDLSKLAQRLYILYGLNYHTYTEYTEGLSDQECADMLGVKHRTSILRARAELEKAGLIVPSEETSLQKQTYHLPHLAKLNSKAAHHKKENEQHAREKEFAKRKASIENDLNHRLTQSEIVGLKRKFGLL